MSEEKFTLGQSAAVFSMMVVMMAAVTILVFPILILTAWMRGIAWNWYCASFHLPPVSLWSMVIVGVFVGMFTPTFPSLKDDLLKFKSWQNSLMSVLRQMLAFGIIVVIHIWFKG